MSAPNGHANGSSLNSHNGSAAETFAPPIDTVRLHPVAEFSPEQLKELTVALEVPFDPRVIEWRVTNTTKSGKPRGQVIPYADQRAYTDRLNALVTPSGWTRKYAVHTSANFQRGKDQKMVAKVFVTCDLTIFGLGSHSATGEEWTDDENACTSAEAQSFKRAASCFGLGRYLYYFSGEWVDLDERKRPKSVPHLPKWATPEGWRQGLRPQQGTAGAPSQNASTTGARARAQANAITTQSASQVEIPALVQQIEALEKPLGKRLYRGLLKTVACAWNPSDIRDVIVLSKVLEYMQGAERGLQRLDAAMQTTGPEGLGPIFKALNVRSLDRVDNLETLKQIVVALEDAAAKAKR
jgi:hypothetical protein